MIKISFLGDIFPADESYTIGFGIKSKTTEKFLNIWKNNIQKVVGQSDFCIGNLESPLLYDGYEKKIFYGNFGFAKLLKDSGINVINIANNHILEHGSKGLEETINILQKQNLYVVGNCDNEGKSKILILEKEDIRIAVVSFSDANICNFENLSYYGDLNEKDVFDVCHRLAKLNVDFKIFIFHWGNEYITYPSLQQRKLAYRLVDYGVDIIIGHHPHVIQPYEKYKDGHIFYSLGNFCFDDVQSRKVGLGLVLSVQLSKGGVIGLNFKGVKVCDTFDSDNLVENVECSKFLKIWNEINDSYKKRCALTLNEYDALYKKELKKNHIIERLLMKFSLLEKIFFKKSKYKKMLLKNIFNYFWAKL